MTEIIWNEPAMQRLEYSPAGEFGRDLIRRGETLAFRGRGTTGVKTGSLRADIKRHPVTRIKNGMQMRVGSLDVKHAAVHHEGSRPHVIRPRRAGGRLRFMIGARVIFASSVRHPGTRPVPFLERWMSEFVR